MKKRRLQRALAAVLAGAMILSTGIIGAAADSGESAWKVDGDTQNAWIGAYGEDGYVLCGWDNKNDLKNLPDYIDSIDYVTEDRSGGYVAKTGSDLQYGLPSKADPNGTRKISYRFDDKRQTIKIKANDNEVHQVTLYAVAENENGRKQSVQMFRADTNYALTDALIMEKLSEGKYVTASFTGSVDIVLNNEVYNPLHTNTLVNGIFFDTGMLENVPAESVEVTTRSGNAIFTLSDMPIEMQATVLPYAATNKDVSWSAEALDSENAGAVSITDDGRLTVESGGKYKVTAAAADGSGVSGEMVVTVLSEGIASWMTDDTSKGNWIGSYGQDGYVLCGWNGSTDLEDLPYYIDSINYITEDRSGGYIAKTGAQYTEGLQDPSDPDGNRKISYRFDDKRQTVRIKANDDELHQITFYTVSENENGRKQSVQLFESGTQTPVSDRIVMEELSKGKYITTFFKGSIDVVFNNENYSPLKTNSLVNGIFFDTDYGDTVPVRRLSVAPADGETIRTELGEVQMAASVLPKHATDPSVTWSIISEDPEIASIDENGLVQINKAGSFDVKAVSNSNPEVSDQVTIVSMNGVEVPEKAEISTISGRFAMIQNKDVRILFDLRTGYYSAYEQESGKPYVLNAYCQVNDEKSINGYAFKMEDITADGEAGKTLRLIGEKAGMNSIVFDVALEDASGDIVMRGGLVNHSGEGVKLMQMYPMVANYSEKGGIFAGENPAENHAVLTGEGNWTVPQVKQGVNTSAKNNLMISYRNKPQLESFLIGGLTTYEFQNTIDTNFDANGALENRGRKSINAKIRIYDNTGKLVDDGQLYVGDKALINFTEKNPYDSLDQYAAKQAVAMDVQLMDFDPYIYECLWYVNWFTPGANNADFAVQEVKDLYARGLANYARPNLRVEPDTYVNPNEQLWWDDAHWLSFGHLTPTYPTMKDWIAGMQAAGGEGGTYMQASYRSDDYCEQYPGHMLYNDPNEGPDYTDPDFIEHMKGVYQNLKDAGLRSIFYDYAGQYKGTGGGYLLDKTGGFEDKYATAVSAYRNIYALPKKYVGRDVRVSENSGEYSGSDLAIGLIDIQRNIGDTNEFNPNIAKVAVNQWYRHRKTKLLYSDVKVFESDDADLRRAQITGTGFFFGKTTLGESVNRMSDEKIKDIGKIVPFPIDGIAARPVGLFEGGYDINPEVLDYKFDSSYDDHILLFWNQTSNQTKTISADLGEDSAFGGVGLDSDKEYEIWDFWDWDYIGRFKGSDILSLDIRKNEMKTMAVREVREDPYLLSTSRHVLQGAFDAKDVSYDKASMTMTGTFDIVANDSYKAIISLNDNNLAIENFSIDNENVTASCKINPFGNYAEIILDAPQNETVNFTLTFKEDQSEEDTIAPSAVSNLRATADEKGIVSLTWNESADNSGFVKYDIYGADHAEFVPGADSLLKVSSTVSFKEDVVRDGYFYYKVVARDAAGNLSEPVMIKTKAFSTAIPVGSLTATCGDSNSASESADKVLDGKENTLWHTDWDGVSRDKMWIDLKFNDGPTKVNSYQYLPRAGAGNGTILNYELKASTDNGQTYQTVATGTFARSDGWKTIEFEEMEVTNLRLYAVTSVGNYASAAEIRVYNMPPLEGIELRETALNLAKDAQKALTADIYPTNLYNEPVSYVSDNELVAAVDENGVVTGIGTGSATITATVGDKQATCVVNVVDGTLDADSLEIDRENGYVSGTPKELTADELIALFAQKEGVTIEVTHADGTPVESGFVGTGCKVVSYVNGEAVDTLEVVVSGDVDGDGLVGIADLLGMKSSILGRDELSGAYFAAADKDGNGILNIFDLVAVKFDILNG